MRTIEQVLESVEDDPYTAVNLVELMMKATEQRKSVQLSDSPLTAETNAGPTHVSMLHSRIEELKVLKLTVIHVTINFKLISISIIVPFPLAPYYIMFEFRKEFLT